MGIFLHRAVFCAGLMLTMKAWGQGPTMHLLTEQYPPFNVMITRPNGQEEVGGLATEMVRELFKRAKIPFSIELMPWLRAFNITTQENNTCLYSTTRTDKREHQFKWIGPLAENAWALYGGPNSPKELSTLEEVRPYLIGGYSGDAESQYLSALGFTLALAPTDNLNLRKLIAGRIQYWATSKARAVYLIDRQKAGQVKMQLTFNKVFLYLACNSDVSDGTIQRLNGALSAMQHDGFYDRLHKRYFHE